MTQEEKDELLESLNNFIELCDKSIAAWTRLSEKGEYPDKDCLEHINENNRQKEACINLKKRVLA